jgi:hypothetical protein
MPQPNFPPPQPLHVCLCGHFLHQVDDPDYSDSFGPAVNMQLNGVFADGPNCPKVRVIDLL